MFCDGHTHILPGMDSGAATAEEGAMMISALYAQGVHAAVLSPHYHTNEPLEQFLLRRKIAERDLRSALDSSLRRQFHLLPSAECALTEDLPTLPSLDALCIPGSHILPISLPLTPLTDHTVSQLAFLIQKRRIVPMILHCERHMALYASCDLERLFHIRQAVFAVSVRALIERDTATFCLRQLIAGRTVIPVTNAHDRSTRPPEIRADRLRIDGTFSEKVYCEMQARSDALFTPCLSLHAVSRV